MDRLEGTILREGLEVNAAEELLTGEGSARQGRELVTCTCKFMVPCCEFSWNAGLLLSALNGVVPLNHW